MPLNWDKVNARLNQAAAVLNRDDPVQARGALQTGIDLGTADVVLMVLDSSGIPVAAFLEWATVVRDGVVTDFIGAVDVVRRLAQRAERRLGRRLTAAATAFPPGTDARLSTHILESAELEVAAVKDEPSCVATLLDLDRAAVVDIGGGTTGTAVARRGQVVFSGDEPTGGHHLTLRIAGHFGISYEAAEARKRRSGARDGILELCKPTLQRIADIVATHIRGRKVERIVLTGGTCCLPGVDGVLAGELGLPVVLPSQPLLLTPLAIAALPRD
jgi:ethanolamine utilization protein EutJ